MVSEMRAEAWRQQLRMLVSKIKKKDLSLTELGNDLAERLDRDELRLNAKPRQKKWVYRSTRIPISNEYNLTKECEWTYLFGPKNSLLFYSLSIGNNKSDKKIESDIEYYCKKYFDKSAKQSGFHKMNAALITFNNLVGGKISDALELNAVQLSSFIDMYPKYSLHTLSFAISAFQIFRNTDKDETLLRSSQRVYGLLNNDIIESDLEKFDLTKDEILSSLELNYSDDIQVLNLEEIKTIKIEMELIPNQFHKVDIIKHLQNIKF